MSVAIFYRVSARIFIQRVTSRVASNSLARLIGAHSVEPCNRRHKAYSSLLSICWLCLYESSVVRHMRETRSTANPHCPRLPLIHRTHMNGCNLAYELRGTVPLFGIMRTNGWRETFGCWLAIYIILGHPCCPHMWTYWGLGCEYTQMETDK